MDTGATDCDFMYNTVFHPDVAKNFLADSDGMIKLMHSYARDEIDVYDKVDVSKNPELKQDGKVVVVTGAGRGIGQAIALMFVKANARAVCICSRTAAELQETKRMLAEVNDDVEVFISVVDVTRECEVEAFFASIVDSFGLIDLVVSNAAIVSPLASIRGGDTMSWWMSFEVNLKGTYLVAKNFARMLGDRSGTLINISSCHALAAVPNQSEYAIGKLAAVRLMETLHIGYPNIRVFSMHPGAVYTDMVKKVQTSTGMVLNWMWTSPHLAGAVCLWLTTEQAEFLRGRWFSANWRVDDLKAREDEIMSRNLLKTSFNLKIGHQVEPRFE